MKTKIKKIKKKLLKTHKKAHKTSLRLFEFIFPEIGVESGLLIVFRSFLSWWLIPTFFILVLLVFIFKKIISLAQNLNISRERLYFLIFIFIFLALVLIMALSQIILPPFSSKASTAVETKRPTNFNDIGNITTSESKAYDNNSSTKATTQTNFSQDPSILFYGWATAGQTYTALDLKLTYSAQAAADDTYAYYYSISGANNCSDYAARSWSTLLAPTSAGASETTLIQSLSASQDLTQLCVKITTNLAGGSDNKNVYTHEIWTEGAYIANDFPTGTFNSAIQRTNGSGYIDISIEASDPENSDTKAKIMYKSGACSGNFNNKPALEEAMGASADYGGNPDIENDNTHQIGSAVPIKTDFGSNTINFVWDSKIDLPAGNGNYCLQLTANDGSADQTVPATQSLVIDNISPANLAPLSFNQINTSYAVLQWPSVTETNFNHYEIWYSQNLTEVQNRVGEVSQNIINNQTTVSATISNLNSGMTYYFKIWATDNYGNEMAAEHIFATIPFPPAYSFSEDVQNIQDIEEEIEEIKEVPEIIEAEKEVKEIKTEEKITEKKELPESKLKEEKTSKETLAQQDNKTAGQTNTKPIYIAQDDKREQIYIVQGEDTLSDIALKYLNSENRWLELVELNKEKYPSLESNPSYILPGWILVISIQQINLPESGSQNTFFYPQYPKQTDKDSDENENIKNIQEAKSEENQEEKQIITEIFFSPFRALAKEEIGSKIKSLGKSAMPKAAAGVLVVLTLLYVLMRFFAKKTFAYPRRSHKKIKPSSEILKTQLKLR